MNIKCHKSKTASENCQFESRYKNIVDQHYPNFAEDFFEYNQKFYCPFHAPMEAVKIAEPNSKKTKKEIFQINKDLTSEERAIYKSKFWKVIYGIINQQTALFSPRFKREDYQSNNEEQIYLERVVFPQSLVLTKDISKNFGEEYQKYCEAVDVVMPRMNFDNCEFCGGIEAKSGDQGEKREGKIYPDLIINGATFEEASFHYQVIFFRVNFTPKKRYGSDFVWFNRAKFECTSIEFNKCEFSDLSLRDAKISCYDLVFYNILIHLELDISCDIGADEDLKKIKTLRFSSFENSSFGHESTYQEITQERKEFDKKVIIDVGGKLICKNRIFQSNVSFFACEFYQAPDFLNTRFDGNVDFQWSKFFDPSSFKYEYYSNYRTIKLEMARKNLYREEKLFHRYEEKCANNQKAFEYESWQGIPIKKIKTFLKNLKIYFQKKSKLATQPAKKLEKKSAEKFETFSSHQSLSEKIFSSLFELICRRGTSFNRIIWVFFCLNFLIFPWFYSADKIFCEHSTLSFSSLAFESFTKSVFYVLHPFYGASELENFKFSCELFISTIQSIFNVAIYVILGFMLRKRFKMSD